LYSDDARMSWAWLWWLVPAVLLFWAVGAYNRLTRLRGDAVAAFAHLDDRWQQQIGLALASVPPHVGNGLGDEPWSGLRAAAQGLSLAMGALRQNTLAAGRATAAGAARTELIDAWLQVQQGARDLAGDLLPETVVQQWQMGLGECDHLGRQFNAAVQQYNEAVQQFPALILARAFGFQPGCGL
jgi:LemA protein